MKKISIFFLSVGILFFTSCSFDSLFNKISLKTDASYKFSIGDVENNALAENFKINELISEDMLPEGAVLYDYYPNKADSSVQKYLLNIPVTSIPVDFSSYFDSTGIGEEIQNMSVNEKVVVPSLSDISYEKELDVSSLNSALNVSVAFGGTIAEGKSNVTFSGEEIEASFSNITYKSGNMHISQYGGGSIPNGTVVTLYDGLENEISNGTFSGGIAIIPLSNKTITNPMKISFSKGVGSGYIAVMEDDAKIQSASGVTVDSSKLKISVEGYTVPKDSNAKFSKCIVKTGELKINLDSNWNNADIKLSMKTTGGLTVDSGAESAAPIVIDLADKTITPEDIKVTPSVSIDFVNADIDFSNLPAIKMLMDISEIKSVSAKVESSDFNSTVNQEKDLPEDMTNYIKKIHFSKCGLTGTYTNKLPAGNSINLRNITCDFFGISNQNKTLSANVTDEDLEIVSTDYNVDLSSVSKIIFNANIELPNWNEAEKEFTLVNVVPGEEYQILIDLKPCLEWDKVSVSTAVSQQSVKSTGMNLSTILNSLDKMLDPEDTGKTTFSGKIKLSDLPVYLYLVRPDIDALRTVSFSGDLKSFYGKLESDNTTVTPLVDGTVIEFLGGSSGITSIPFVDSMPDFRLETIVSGIETVTTNLNQTKYSAKNDFSPFTSETNATEDYKIFIDYDLTLQDESGASEITISKADLDKSQNQENAIAINALIVLPLSFTATDDIKVDVMSLSQKGDPSADLFGREEAPDTSDMEDYIELIEEVSIDYKLNKKPFMTASGKPIVMSVDFGGDKKEFTMDDGSIDISYSSFKKMFEYPFHPTVDLDIYKDSVFTVPRDMGISARVNLSVKTNGTITLWEKE